MGEKAPVEREGVRGNRRAWTHRRGKGQGPEHWCWPGISFSGRKPQSPPSPRREGGSNDDVDGDKQVGSLGGSCDVTSLGEGRMQVV